MRSTRLLVPFLVLAALLTACGESNPVRPSVAHHVNARADVIHRDVAEVFALFGGGPSNNGLTLFVNSSDAEATAASLCANLPPAGQPAPGTTKIVFTPSGRLHELAHSRTVDVTVFQISTPGYTQSWCDVLGAPVIATGSVTYTTTQGIPIDGDPGALTFHMSVSGVVTLASGGEARIFGEYQLVVLSGTVRVDREVVRLTPL